MQCLRNPNVELDNIFIEGSVLTIGPQALSAYPAVCEVQREAKKQNTL